MNTASCLHHGISYAHGKIVFACAFEVNPTRRFVAMSIFRWHRLDNISIDLEHGYVITPHKSVDVFYSLMPMKC